MRDLQTEKSKYKPSFLPLAAVVSLLSGAVYYAKHAAGSLSDVEAISFWILLIIVSLVGSLLLSYWYSAKLLETYLTGMGPGGKLCHIEYSSIGKVSSYQSLGMHVTAVEDKANKRNRIYVIRPFLGSKSKYQQFLESLKAKQDQFAKS